MEFFSSHNAKWDSQLISQEEAKILVEAFLVARGRKNESCSEDEMLSVIKWAEEARVSELLLDMVLSGDLIIDMDDDGAPVFSSATEKDDAQD